MHMCIYIYIYIHTYIHTYIHACIHTYIHTYIYITRCLEAQRELDAGAPLPEPRPEVQ